VTARERRPHFGRKWISRLRILPQNYRATGLQRYPAHKDPAQILITGEEIGAVAKPGSLHHIRIVRFSAFLKAKQESAKFLMSQVRVFSTHEQKITVLCQHLSQFAAYRVSKPIIE
jgi:hypothetical protein